MTAVTTIFHRGLICQLQLRSAKPAKSVSNEATDLESWEFEFDFVPIQLGKTEAERFEKTLQDLGLQYGAGRHAQEIKRQMLMVWNARGLVDERNVSVLMDGNKGTPTKIALIDAILRSSN